MIQNIETTIDKSFRGVRDGDLSLWLRVGVKLEAHTVGDRERLMALWRLLAEGGTTEQVVALQTLRQHVLPPPLMAIITN